MATAGETDSRAAALERCAGGDLSASPSAALDAVPVSRLRTTACPSLDSVTSGVLFPVSGTAGPRIAVGPWSADRSATRSRGVDRSRHWPATCRRPRYGG